MQNPWQTVLQRAETSPKASILRDYHLLDLKSMQNHYVFGAFSGRVGEIAGLGDVSARWSTVCQEFYIFYFRGFSYALGYINCARKTLRSNVPLPSPQNSNQNFLKPWRNRARCWLKKSFWIRSSYPPDASKPLRSHGLSPHPSPPSSPPVQVTLANEAIECTLWWDLLLDSKDLLCS